MIAVYYILSSVQAPQHRCDIEFENNNNKSLHSINESDRKSIKITLADISLKKFDGRAKTESKII